MDDWQTRAVALLESLRVAAPKTKDDVRAVMAERRIETITACKSKLLDVQNRALALLRKVNYADIRPRLVPVAPRDSVLWQYYRHILSSAPWTARPGRSLFFFCVDERSGGVLGIVDVGSDLVILGPRDRHIGWTHERKFSGGLNHLLNVGTCVGSHPFGVLTGGKFMVSAAKSSEVCGLWERRYGDVLAGLTTTSLYGKSAVYNRVPGLEYLGDTAGQGMFQVCASAFREMKRLADTRHTAARTVGTGINVNCRLEIMRRIAAECKFPLASVATHQPRGVYFGATGPNALQFLRGEVSQFTPQTQTQSEIADWWLERWYAMRWPKVREEIAVFDWSIYGVERQLHECRKLIRERSSEIGTPAPTGGGAEMRPARSIS